MFTNADVTMYLYRKEEGTEKYIRLPIEGVYWEEISQSTLLRTGEKNSASVLLVIPLESLEYPVDFTPGKDMAVKGIIEYEVDSSSQAALSKSLTALKAAHKLITITSADAKLYGSEAVQHYELASK
ncbi:DUF6751 family protein [Lacrimispora sp.]|uniref:DUF6751 family protein n=1 Tax=Lacrimispora sp. TaxID=2719234 RepID=UPI00289DE05D|nr:DUF6751 family protein [Lacrimispora sp.]